MTTYKTNLLKKATALLLAVTVLVISLPAMILPVTAATPTIVIGDKSVDVSTMDSWQQLFPRDNTSQAGRIWTDKSVFANADVFQDLIDADGQEIDVTMLDPDNNFLVVLSALASNKSIVGYSYTPTDTMLVLDVSGSMGSSNYVDDLVKAANDAIKRLLALNYHNRVGVVLYSGNSDFGNSQGNTATILLPLDHYTQSYTGTDRVWQEGEGRGDRGEWVDVPVSEKDIFLVNNGQSSIRINRGVQNKAQQGTNEYMEQSSKSVSGGTYIQNGVYMAMEEFLGVEDTVIPDGQNQAGTARTPIFVLMSDGKPTTATTNFAGQNNAVGIGTSNLGDGGTVTDDVLADAIDFVNQLTAAYATAKVNAHYAATTPLFYTLGLGANNANLNSAVLNPAAYTHTDTLWANYVATKNGSGLVIDIEEKEYNRQGQDITEQASIVKVPDLFNVKQKNYVTESFSANNATGLINAFDKIVNQIIIQSLYYPTLVQDGNYDHDGYIEFIDDIGHYMQVKDIKGIMLGNTFFTGERLAKNFTSAGGEFFNPDGSYSDLANNVVWSVQQRIGIANVQDARDLINSAYETGQLSYNTETGEWSNYIGWYADDAGNYMGHWHEGHTEADIPVNAETGVKATYINRSYGMLGEVTDEHTATDLMYISTQVHTRISDNNVSVIWRVPASLIPVVSYNISLNGETVGDATSATIEYDAAEPIRILFEVGLTEEITKVNLSEIITDPQGHILDENGDNLSDDGKYYFYTNWWNDDALSHENPSKVEDTIVFFEPSIQNERYYYAEETPVLVNTGTEQNPAYTKYSGTMPNKDDGTTYYREYVVFVGDTANATEAGTPAIIERWYEPMSDGTISVLQDKHQNADGTWDIPMGTVHRVLEPYNLEKTDKTLTGTLDYVRYPVIEEIPQKDSFHIGAILGNNGRIAVDIPQGIKLSKTIDETLYGTDDTYTFTVTAPGLSGNVEAYTAAADGSLTPLTVTFTGGTAEVSLKAGESVYLLGLDENVTYTVSEAIEGDYAVKSITVDGTVQSGTASADATVAPYQITEVVFENTLVVNTGTIVVSKEIVHDDRITYNADQEYTFEWYNEATPDTINTFVIKASETKTLSDLAAGTYVIREINIPDGYTPRNNDIRVQIVNAATEVVPVHFINDYTPAEVKPSTVVVSGTKILTGRQWQVGDSFTFKLQVLEGANWIDLAERTVAYNGAGDYEYTFDFGNDTDLKDYAFRNVGTQYFRVIESIPDEKIGGVTYDETYRYFRIAIADATMDGYLEIQEVVGQAPVTVTSTGISTGTAWNVDADFTNMYAASGTDELIITIDKTVLDKVGANTGKDGFTFGLYTVEGTTPILISDPTDANGKTSFDLTFSAAMAGREYHFEIREIIPEDKINGMIYVTEPYPVTIKIVDNLDGTITAVIETPENDVEGITVSFENVYDPADAKVTLSGTKVMEERDFDANEFIFELYEDGKNEPKLAANKSKENGGTFTFETLTFDTIGTYGYTIKERTGTLGGVSYSGKSYDVDILVSDDADNDGTLDVQVKIDGKTVALDQITSTITFVNTYTIEPTDIVLEGTKTLEGRDLTDGEFSFELYDAAGKLVETVKNDADGKIAFTPIEVTEAGTYVYTIKEVNDGAGGMDYDDTVYTVTGVVEDNGDGTFAVAYTYEDQEQTETEGITFVNTYTIKSTDIVLEGTKTLEGRDLTDGEFSFELYDAAGKLVETVKNDADGKIAFTPIEVTEAGTYVYTIKEVNDGAGGMDYDDTVYTVTVVVEDNGDGTFAVTYTYEDQEQTETEGITFVNTYTIKPTDIVLEGTKTLEGRDLTDGEFSFELYDEAGELVETVKNDADGKIAFTPIEVTEAGTYSYTIKEVKGAAEGVTYDDTVYTVTVVVEDNGDGTFSMDYAYADQNETAVDGIRFVNDYAPLPPENPETGVTTNPYLWVALLFVAGGCLFGTTMYGKKKNSER